MTITIDQVLPVTPLMPPNRNPGIVPPWLQHPQDRAPVPTRDHFERPGVRDNIGQ